MDGIAVRDDMRGHGIGTQLLSSIQQFGNEKQYATNRLVVIDTNSNAKRLYEKMGFVATETVEFAYLRWLLGFGASTTLVYQVAQAGLGPE